MSLQQPKPPSANSQHAMRTELIVDEISENLEQMLTRLESGKTLASRLDQDLEELKSYSNTNLLNEDGNVIRNSGSIISRLTKDLKNEVLLDRTNPHLVHKCGEVVGEIHQVIKALERVADDVSKFIPGSYPKSVNNVLNLLENIFEGVLKVSLFTSAALKKLAEKEKEKQQKDDQLMDDSELGGKRTRSDKSEKRDDKKDDKKVDSNKIAEESPERSHGHDSNKNDNDDYMGTNEDEAVAARNKKRQVDPLEENTDLEPRNKQPKLDTQKIDHAVTARDASNGSNPPASESETTHTSKTHHSPYKQQSNTEHTKDEKSGQTSAGSATSIIKGDMSDEDRIAYGIDAFAKLNGTPILPDQIEMLRRFLALTPNNSEFNRLFGELEKTMFRNSEKHVKCPNGEDFLRKRDLDPKQDKVYVIEINDKDFGLKTPQITFGSLKQSVTALADTSTKRIQTVCKSILKIIEQIDNNDLSQPSQILSCQSQEITKLGEFSDIEAPAYVKQDSLICQLKQKAAEEFGGLGSKANTEKLNVIEKNLANPVFLSVSTAMSFTDLHIAPSATCVYYHVLVGQKVMFIAPPSQDNLELYYHYKRTATKTDKFWFVSLYFDVFERVEINEGQVIVIPAGWLSFEFNPMDTIAIGGYYLRENDLSLSIKIKKFEEDTLAKESNEALPNYWWTLFVYSDLIFIKKYEEAERNNSTTNEMRKTAETLYKELAVDRFLLGRSWYRFIWRKDIITKLGKLLGIDAETATLLEIIGGARELKKK